MSTREKKIYKQGVVSVKDEFNIRYMLRNILGFPGGSDRKKNLPAMRETWV